MKFNSTNASSGNNHCSDVSIAIGASNKKDDYFPTCSNCNLEIKDKYYTKLLDRSWHNSCFVCCACKTKLGSKCFSRDGFIFCQMDFQTQAWTLCSGCNRSITPDELVQRIHDYIFHVSCLTCSICKAHLQTGDKIFIVHGYPCKVYCHNDYKQYVIGRNSSESAKVMPAGGQWTSPAVHQAYNQQFPHRQSLPPMAADYGYPQPPSLDNSRGVFRPTPLPATSRNHPQISNVHPQSQPLQPQQQQQPPPPQAPVTGMSVASPGSNSFPCQPIAQHPPNYKQQPEQPLKQQPPLQHAQPPQINTQSGHPQFHNGHVMQPRYKEEHAMSPSAPHSARSPNLAGGFEGIQPPFMPQGHHMPVAGNLTNGVTHHGYLQGQTMQQSPAQSSDSNSVDMIEYRQSSQQPLPANRALQGSSGVPAASMGSGGGNGVLTNNSSAFSPCPGNNASNVNQQQAQPARGFAPPGTQQQPHQSHLYANGGVPPGVVAHPKMLPPHIVCDDEKSSDNVSVSSENDLQCSPKSGASMGSSSGGTNSNPNSVSSAANTPPASTQSGGGAATPPTSAKRGPGNHLKGPQAEFLRSYYLTNQKPSKEEREAIAAEIGVEAKTIATWFQNRRSKEKIKREKAAAAAASAGLDQSASENSQSSSLAHSPSASLEPSSHAPPAPLPSSQPGTTANQTSNAPVLTQEAISQSMTNNTNHQANNATTSQEHQPASPAPVAHLSESSGYSSYVIKDSNHPITNDFNMNAQNPQPNETFHHSNFAFAKIESNNEQFQLNQPNFDHNGATGNDQNMEYSTSGHYYVTNDVQQYPTHTAVPPQNNDASGSNEPYSVVQSAFKSFNTAQPAFTTSSPAQPQFASVVSQNQSSGSTTFVPAQ